MTSVQVQDESFIQSKSGYAGRPADAQFCTVCVTQKDYSPSGRRLLVPLHAATRIHQEIQVHRLQVQDESFIQSTGYAGRPARPRSAQFT